MSEPTVSSHLLTYDVTTTPLTALAGETARIRITVSNTSDTDIQCKQLVLHLPVGPNAQDLTASTENLTANVTPTPAGTNTGTAVALSDNDLLVLPHAEHFTLTSGQETLAIDLAGIELGVPGSAHLTILETATEDIAHWPLQAAETTVLVGKHLVDQSQQDALVTFWAEHYSTGRDWVSAARVSAGRPVRLCWAGVPQGIPLELHYGTDHIELPAGATSKAINAGIQQATTFLLTTTATSGTARRPLASLCVAVEAPTLQTATVTGATTAPMVTING
jgi:hypothetical protein